MAASMRQAFARASATHMTRWCTQAVLDHRTPLAVLAAARITSLTCEIRQDRTAYERALKYAALSEEGFQLSVRTLIGKYRLRQLVSFMATWLCGRWGVQHVRNTCVTPLLPQERASP